jgi:hypothetical protein
MIRWSVFLQAIVTTTFFALFYLNSAEVRLNQLHTETVKQNLFFHVYNDFQPKDKIIYTPNLGGVPSAL